jgi:membrane fusion protein, multidrug efflux system
MGSCSRRTTFAAVAIAATTVACEKPAEVKPSEPEVYVADVVQKDVPVYVDLVGETAGFQDVEIRARVEGFLQSVNFQEGAFVRAGQPLYEIDRKPLEATLAGAKADAVTAGAVLNKADNDVARYTPLAAKQAVSQEELDNARASQDAARSRVEAAKAAVEKASLDLGYTRVMSPISGLVGITEVKAGNLVGRGENTLLTTVSQIDPIIFRVGVSEADYLRVARRGSARGGKQSDVSGIQLTLADGTVYPHTGRLGPVERAVDPTTGTLGVQIMFPNPDLLLRPGQYGRARILLDTKKAALLVPQRAVQELQNLYSVAVVDADDKISFRNVKVGERQDSLWVIDEGLKPGERVVVEGLQRVQEGIKVAARSAPPEATATTGSQDAAPGRDGH